MNVGRNLTRRSVLAPRVRCTSERKTGHPFMLIGANAKPENACLSRNGRTQNDHLCGPPGSSATSIAACMTITDPEEFWIEKVTLQARVSSTLSPCPRQTDLMLR